MSVKQDRINTAMAICNAAASYKANLVGREFLFVFDNRYIEVLFQKDSFKHLTGVDSYLSAEQFYKNAIRNKLTWNQLYFTSDHPFQLCQKKLKHLASLQDIIASDAIMLESVVTDSQVYKFGATNLSFTLCFSQPVGVVAPNAPYHVFSLRDEDCFNKSSNTYVVTHVFSKENDEKLYTTLEFADKNIDNSTLPESVVLQLDDNLKKSLNLISDSEL